MTGTGDCCLIMEFYVKLDLMHFLSRIILKRSKIILKKSRQPCEVGVEVDLGVLPLCVKLPYKFQDLGLVREAVLGTGLALNF